MDYSKTYGFIRNRKITEEIVSLDPVKDHCRIVYLMTGYEFPWDIIRSLEVALMKTFCSPRVSGLLHRTGEFRRHRQKRYDDTALLVADLCKMAMTGKEGSRRLRILIEFIAFTISKMMSIFLCFQPLCWYPFIGLILMAGEKRAATSGRLYFIFSKLLVNE